MRTRPDLRPPDIKVNSSSPDAAPGYLIVSPKKEPGGQAPSQDAPLIIDRGGEPVWFRPLRDSKADAFNFEVQEYGERRCSPGGSVTTAGMARESTL